MTNSGQAAFITIILIGGIVIFFGTNLAFLAFSFTNTTYGVQSSAKALALANAGARDALMRLARNKDYANTSYDLILGGNDQAAVSVENNSMTAGTVTITSLANVNLYQRKIEVIASLSSSTGQLSVVSWKQVK